MASSTLRSRTEAEAGRGGVLPTDAIYEILIRVTVEELYRLRVVCRPWRSLLSDPQFVAAHAARHQGPLIVSGHGRSCRDDDGILCRIIDLSGRVIKQIRSTSTVDERLISTHHNLACIAKANSNRWECQLLNLDTGDRFSLPEELSQDHTPWNPDFRYYRASAVALGQVASTGELKLLRVIGRGFFNSTYYPPLSEVFTLGGSSDEARWRGKKAPQDRVDTRPLSRVVVDGVVYFLLHEYAISDKDFRPKGIASFDLAREEWRPILRGPARIYAYYNYDELSLADLNGSLVLVDCTSRGSMDLWFLMDFGKGLWAKQHTVKLNLSVCDTFRPHHPLVILKNGSIVTYIESTGLLMIYNPRTNTYTDVAKTGSHAGIGLYTGELLSIANDAI